MEFYECGVGFGFGFLENAGLILLGMCLTGVGLRLKGLGFVKLEGMYRY